MTAWSVSVAMAAPMNVSDDAGDRQDADPTEVSRFAVLLAAHHGAGGFDRRRLDATVSVDADTALAAIRQGTSVVTRAAHRCGLRDWTVTGAEVITESELQERLAKPQLPALVGVKEVMAIVKLSRQRVDMLRRTPGFPQPLATLAAGPVWDQGVIEHWVSQRDPRPGWPPGRSRNPESAAAPDSSEPIAGRGGGRRVRESSPAVPDELSGDSTS
jgi:predicted DNA-binding transcriptional regulator AlpA